MLIRNVRRVDEEGMPAVQLLLQDDLIQTLSAYGGNDQLATRPHAIDFDDAIIFPGLINSHDHLDFNLFPPLGNKVYHSYREWGEDIHHRCKETMADVLRVPMDVRVKWGVYKNLFAGVTTVVNHGAKLTLNGPVIDVRQDAVSLHSVGFEKNWRWKLNQPRWRKKIFAMHAGEGTDDTSNKEIDKLTRWNLTRKKIVAIHGIAMQPEQAAFFKALVWCPASNYFLFNTTAMVDTLKQKTPVVFGTDSTLTAQWNIWEQLRQARATALLTDKELFAAVTRSAADVWELGKRGLLLPGYRADLVIARANGYRDGMDAFFAVDTQDILLVISGGRIRLFDASVKRQLEISGIPLGNFTAVVLSATVKYCAGDPATLVREIHQHYPGAVLPVEEYSK